jgi:hypothetical protein
MLGELLSPLTIAWTRETARGIAGGSKMIRETANADSNCNMVVSFLGGRIGLTFTVVFQ